MPAITSSGARQELAGCGSSAPVLEFLCLFTHDLQRKQKRWQDGRLKYHTFNKRVMVYDDRGNSVGDMHWQRDWEFDEGEEIKLDRGGVIVQVQECVGQENQDLSDLLDKRAKDKEERQSRTAARRAPVAFGLRTPALAPRVYPAQLAGTGSHHRRLDQVLTPTGHHGRAVVPTESPFEQRQRDQETPDRSKEASSLKRTKYDDTAPSKLGYAQSLFGAPLTLSAVPMSSAPIRPVASATSMHSEPASSQEGAPQASDSREWESNPSKRRKRDDMPPSKMGYSQSLFGASLDLSAVPISSASISRRTTSATTRMQAEPSSAQEDDPQQRNTANDRHETPASISVRAGLSRATATAPLLKTRLQPLARGLKPSVQNKAARIRSQREIVVEVQQDTVGSDLDFEEDVPSALRNQNIAKPVARDRNFEQKGAPKPKTPPPVIILDEGDDDCVDINNETIVDLPPPRSKKPVPKAALTEAAPTKTASATKQSKTSKNTKSSKTTEAQYPGSKSPAEGDSGTARGGLYVAPEGPRAQLRIQPRQKRGLLVSSEKGNKPKKPKVRHALNHAELEDDTEFSVQNPAPAPDTAPVIHPAPTLEEDDSFASFVDAVQESRTAQEPKVPSQQRKARNLVVRDEVNGLETATEALVSCQNVNGNQPPSTRTDDGPEVQANSENAFSVPSPAALRRNVTETNDMGAARPQGTTRPSKKLPVQQNTAALDQGNAFRLSDLPQAPPSRDTRHDDAPKSLQLNLADDEDISERPRTGQIRKRVTLALDESDDEEPPTRRNRKRITMASDGSDDEGSATNQRSSRKTPVSDESEVEKRPTRQSKSVIAIPFDENDDEGPPTRQTRRRTTAAVEESDSDELPQVPVGPRLARLRKSVKSREVIGFVPSSSPVIEASTIPEPRPPPIPAPLPAPSLTPDLMDAHLGLDRADTNSLAITNGPKVTAPVTNVPQQQLVTAAVLHDLPIASTASPSPPSNSTADIASAVRLDDSHPTTTSRGAPVKKSGQDHTPVHLEQSIHDPPSGKPPQHHVASASGAFKAGQSAVANQQIMVSLDADLTSLSAAPLTEEEPSLVTKEVDGASRSHKAVSHSEVYEHPIAVPQDVGASSVASNNPNGQGPKVPPINTRPKIANPATRGRKAALKSHAAGQVPQSILPLEPTPGRLNMRPPETTRPEAAVSGRPKYKMQLPGFTSAKETAKDSAGDIGPWSREAHDLLGSGRPST